MFTCNSKLTQNTENIDINLLPLLWSFSGKVATPQCPAERVKFIGLADNLKKIADQLVDPFKTCDIKTYSKIELKNCLRETKKCKSENVPNTYCHYGQWFVRANPRGLLKIPNVVFALDGVEAKAKIAQTARRHDTIGVDLVGLTVNEILRHGAKALGFSSACNSFNRKDISNVMKGVTAGMTQIDCALFDSKISEVPEIYSTDNYVLISFAIGVVDNDDQLPMNDEIGFGDYMFALPTNGVNNEDVDSLQRTLSNANVALTDQAPFSNSTFGEELLPPVNIYATPILSMFGEKKIKAIIPVIGGDFITDLYPVLRRYLAVNLDANKMYFPPILKWIASGGMAPNTELQKTFNSTLCTTFL